MKARFWPKAPWRRCRAIRGSLKSIWGAEMLEVQAIDQYYGGSHTLRGVSVSLRQGECLGLLGRHGVGKTTLRKCLMGVLQMAGGKVLFTGRDISRLPPTRRDRKSTRLNSSP